MLVFEVACTEPHTFIACKPNMQLHNQVTRLVNCPSSRMFQPFAALPAEIRVQILTAALLARNSRTRVITVRFNCVVDTKRRFCRGTFKTPSFP